MYLATILCTTAILASAAALKQEIYKLPQDKVLAAHKISEPCAKEINVDPKEYFGKLIDGTMPRDVETSKTFMYCFTLKGGFIEKDGHIVVDKIASLLGDHPLVEEFKEALRDCNKITKENHLETVMAMNTCIVDTAPVKLVL